MNKILTKCSLHKDIYIEKLSTIKPNILICEGPAGTGKTMEACKSALFHINESHYKKLIITRPSVSVEESLGYLPGDINNKMEPWMIPIYEYLEEFSNERIVNRYAEDGIIDILPLGFMRGRTFSNTLIIADEMQNSTKKQMYNLLTRIGDYSKLIITGDTNQCDIPVENSGLVELIDKYKSFYSNDEPNHENDILLLNLDETDIKRSEIVKEIIKMYGHL